MTAKRLVFTLFILSIVLNSIYFASALTATVGNARMVLRMEVGETLERSILVRNVNDVPVTIELSVSGALADGIDLNEDSFDLAPGEEKKAYFTVSPEEDATTNSKINIKFIPEEGNAVGFSSAIIVIAGEGGEPTPIEDNTDNTDSEAQNDTNVQVPINQTQNDKKTTSGLKIGSTSVKPLSSSSFSLTPPLILGTSTLLLAVILLGLLIYSFKVKKEVKRGRGRKSA